MTCRSPGGNQKSKNNRKVRRKKLECRSENAEVRGQK
jgi:hypothetical protein